MISHPVIKIYQMALVEAAQSLWPILAGRSEALLPEFYPVLDFEKGDIETDFCKKIAKLIRRSPGEIARRLCEKLAPELQAQCRISEQSFGFYLHDKACLELLGTPAAVSGCPDGQAHSVFVPRPSTALSGWPHLRLAVSGCLQFLMLRSLGEKAGLYLGAEELCGVSLPSAGEVVRKLLSVCASCLPPETRLATCDAASDFLEKNRGGRLSIWLSSESIEKGNFRKLMQLAKTCEIQLEVHCPPHTWFAHFDESVSRRTLAAWSAADLCSLLYYMSSPVEALHLDVQVAQLNEKENLRWFLEATLKRFVRTGVHELCRYTGLPDGLAPAARAAALRAAFLPAFYARAAIKGALGDYHTALMDLLTRANCIFNNPAFRRDCDCGQVSSGDLYALACVEKALRAVISLCLVIRGTL